MAVQVINQKRPIPYNKSTPFVITEYIGLSTDIKPLDCERGSTLKELDTDKIYLFNGQSWEIDIVIDNALQITPDNITAYITTLNLFDYMNNNGNVFTISKTAVGVVNNGYLDIRVKSGSKPSYLEILYSSEGKSYFKTYLNTTYSANGTLLTPFPRNSGSTKTLQSLIYQAPTINVLGQIRGDDFIGKSSGNPQTRAGGGGTVSGTIIAPTHDLLIRLQNVSGAISDLNLIINILEF
jgi:hypothetical protein